MAAKKSMMDKDIAAAISNSATLPKLIAIQTLPALIEILPQNKSLAIAVILAALESEEVQQKIIDIVTEALDTAKVFSTTDYLLRYFSWFSQGIGGISTEAGSRRHHRGSEPLGQRVYEGIQLARCPQCHQGLSSVARQIFEQGWNYISFLRITAD